MHSFGFRVEALDPNDNNVPIAVAGQTMIDVQKLITDIGCMILKNEMRLQNGIPGYLKKKYELTINSGSETGIGTGPSRGNEASLEKALYILCSTFNFLGKGAVGNWMIDNFKDNEYRALIAKDLLTLVDHLDGYKLIYEIGENKNELITVDRDKIATHIDAENEYDSAMIGVISRDDVQKRNWNISNDDVKVPIRFDRNIVPSDIPSFAAAGPVIVLGRVKRDGTGHVCEAKDVYGCYTFPAINIHSVITKDGDIELLNPIVASPSYNSYNGTWTLKNMELGINETRTSWDECVIAFNEYAKFLFDTYSDPSVSFDGEERDVQQFLLSLLPA